MSNTDGNLEQYYQCLIGNPDPIADDDPRYEEIFRDLQGGIIKSYGRKCYLYIFISFSQEREKVKQWIRDEMTCSVTSTWKQLQDTKFYKYKIKELENQGFDPLNYPGQLCQNFFLSYQGYQTLGFDINKSDELFKGGMKKWWEESYNSNTPKDSEQSDDSYHTPSQCWDIGGNDNIHALISLSHNCFEQLKNEAAHILEKFELRGVGKIVGSEVGYVLRNQDGVVGPFGFVDNISQPLFLKSNYDKYRSHQDIKKWDPKASLNLVLTKDPYGKPYSFGSYCVWQKLETDYKCFKDKVAKLAETLWDKKEGDDALLQEKAAALVIGRFKDGTPLDLHSEKKDKDPIKNDFDYSDDKEGRKCPLHAHIRKVNPRMDSAPDPEARKKNRILRAGVTYFDAPQVQQTLDSKIWQVCLNKLEHLNEVSQRSLTNNIEDIRGLLFVCFQSDIVNHFSKLQIEWADDRKFPRSEPKYLDPVIGHPNTKGSTQPPKPQEWPKKWNAEGDISKKQEDFSPFSFYGCVTDKGGEFFFAPSISFLKNLI